MNTHPPLVFPSLAREAMSALAICLAPLLAPSDIITLSGDLGSGKTSFARALIQALCGEETHVTSPTFTLMQSYTWQQEERENTLWHLDLYRLKTAQEAWELGLEEIWPHITLIEWAEIIAPLILPENRLNIAFDCGDSEDNRTLVLQAGQQWKERIMALQGKFF